jgi:uncharacterized membrane protein
MEVLRNLFIYGILGILTEVLFTGIKSLIEKNWRATSQTYLWMGPIYALGGLTLKFIHDSVVVSHNIYINALLLAFMFYVPLIYGFEFLSGWLLEKIIGRVPWEYGPGRFTIIGLIRLDYAPFWFLLALCFEPITIILNKISIVIKG